MLSSPFRSAIKNSSVIDRARLPLIPGNGIAVYFKNGSLLEHAQQMAAHESAR